MPTEFQKVMDMLLAKFREVFVFIDDILIVTKGTKDEHLDKVREILKTLDHGIVMFNICPPNKVHLKST